MKRSFTRILAAVIAVILLATTGFSVNVLAANSTEDVHEQELLAVLEQEYVKLQSHRAIIADSEANGYRVSDDEKETLLSSAGVDNALAELKKYYTTNNSLASAEWAYTEIVQKYAEDNAVSTLAFSENIFDGPGGDGLRLSLGMCYFTQETDYYCGPATVKAVLNEINGTSSTQTVYANALGTTEDGTDMTKIAGVLNKYQKEHTYIKDEIPSQSLWLTQIKNNIMAGYPVVLDIRVQDIVTGFPYTTQGHFVAVGGIYLPTGAYQVEIVDPHYDHSRVEWISADTVYEVNHAHPNDSYIY